MIQLSLDRHEINYAKMIGNIRYNEAVKAGKKNQIKRNLTPRQELEIHYAGAAGEMAFAKAMNYYFNATINTYKTGYDVHKMQVRTRTKDHYDLLVRDNDNNNDIFVLVLKNVTSFKICGWIKGSDAKKQQYFKNYGNMNPAYFVPQSHLNSIDTLKNTSNEV